ncbi:MAG: IS1634 family transposase [Holophagales bacterium]|nr:IS1634 family transposase [Holophagales bacterium]
MFLRVKRGGNKAHPHDYLQLVESYRDNGRPKQRVLLTLGRLDRLRDSGQIDRLTDALAKLSLTRRVLDASQISSCRSKSWGPTLVFERLWKEQNLPSILGRLAEGRKFRFDVERVAFALALQRLCRPGSDLEGSRWIPGVEAEGFEKIELQHLYRTVGFLADIRQPLEKELFLHDRDLLSLEIDLLFLDTTSVYTYRQEETELRRRGYSRDRRGDLPQMVLCVAVDREGWPIAWEILPGNTADKAAMKKMVAALRQRFSIRNVVLVADRGMMSQKMVSLLTGDEQAPYDYILGCKMRRQKEISEEVLARAGRYRKVAENLEVKEVLVEDRRYVVCRNPQEVAKDAAARAAMLEKLEDKLSAGPKALMANKGYARFLKVKKSAVEIDPKAVEADQRLDGKFVLRTSTDLPAEEVALAYKSLWRVERTFREEKSTLEVRPIYHQSDEQCIGHIVASFLALRLEVDLQQRLSALEVEASWPQIMSDLEQVQAVHLELDDQSWRVRTDLCGAAYAAFQAAGVRPPPRVAVLQESSKT